MMPRMARGRPLVALFMILGGWVAARAAFWDGLGPQPVMPDRLVAESFAGAKVRDTGNPATAEQVRHIVRTDVTGRASLRTAPIGPIQGQSETDWTPMAPTAPVERVRPSAPHHAGALSPDVPSPPPHIRSQTLPVRIAAGHQLLWMAALSKLPFPAMPSSPGAASRLPAPTPFYAAGRKPNRWSADGWMLLRSGGKASLSSGVTPATYGSSQLGAILRYRLAPENAHRPTAYVRVTSALSGPRERDVAAGFSARPVRSIPVVAAVELRASQRPDKTSLRPAAMLVTEVAPFDLPLESRGEFYAQAGYVGGKDATAFADGQLRVDKRVLRLGMAELRAGGGSWAGAQEGASRIDVGPSATIGVPVGDRATARVGLDWRLRVGGNADPKSGAAITLSAGF